MNKFVAKKNVGIHTINIYFKFVQLYIPYRRRHIRSILDYFMFLSLREDVHCIINDNNERESYVAWKIKILNRTESPVK